jgi:hypothetical protein
MKRRLLLIGAAVAVQGLLIGALPARAHHSIASVYDYGRDVKLEGTVKEFHFVFPHPFLTIEVKQGNQTVSWLLEMDNRGEMERAGITIDSLKAGDRVVVTGNPERKGAPSVYIKRIDRPADGFGWEQVNGRPQVHGKR